MRSFLSFVYIIPFIIGCFLFCDLGFVISAQYNVSSDYLSIQDSINATNDGDEITPNRYITVNAEGTGNGSVTSSPGEIQFTYPQTTEAVSKGIAKGSPVTVEAKAVNGDLVFLHHCQDLYRTVIGNNTSIATCNISELQYDTIISAIFGPAKYLTVNAYGNGSGGVQTDTGGLNYTYPATSSAESNAITKGAPVRISATAFSNSNASFENCETIGGYTSGQSTYEASCTLSGLEQSGVVTAIFARNTGTITVNSSGHGAGSISTTHGGVSYNYPAVSSATTSTVPPNQWVKIWATASDDSNATFENCEAIGGETYGQGTSKASCTLTGFELNKTVTAKFAINSNTITVNSFGQGFGSISTTHGGVSYNYPTVSSASTSTIPPDQTVVVSATADEGSVVLWDECYAKRGHSSGNITSTINCTFENFHGDIELSASFAESEGDVCTEYRCGSSEDYFTTKECVTEFDNYFKETEGDMPPCIPRFEDDIFYINELFCYANWKYYRAISCDPLFNPDTDIYNVIDERNRTPYDICLMNKQAQFDVCLLSIDLNAYSHCHTTYSETCDDEYEITGNYEAYQVCLESIAPQVDECSKGITDNFILTYINITANAEGDGKGNVTASSGELDFSYPAVSSEISDNYSYGSSVILTADAGAGSNVSFVDCTSLGGMASGNGSSHATCTLSDMHQSKELTVVFSKNRYTVSKIWLYFPIFLINSKGEDVFIESKND